MVEGVEVFAGRGSLDGVLMISSSDLPSLVFGLPTRPAGVSSSLIACNAVQRDVSRVEPD